MLEGIPFLRGTAPWVLMDFRSPVRMHPFQAGYNRKGLLSERGETQAGVAGDARLLRGGGAMSARKTRSGQVTPRSQSSRVSTLPAEGAGFHRPHGRARASLCSRSLVAIAPFPSTPPSNCRCCFPTAPCCSATGLCRCGAGRRRARRSKSRSTGAAPTATASADGTWRVELPAHAAGGPYVLEVREQRRRRHRPCATCWSATCGWPRVSRTWSGRSRRRRTQSSEIARAHDAGIRHFKVPKSWSERARGAPRRRRMAGGIAADGRRVLRGRLLLRA